jgi:hypothetical protein
MPHRFNSRPADKASLGLVKGQTNAWQSLRFYSDVARVADRFCMTDIEAQAVEHLKELMVTSLKDIAARTRTHSKERMASLISTLRDTELLSDTSLGYSVRNAIQYSCTVPASLPIPELVTLFHIPDLRHQDPALFGFLFIVLMSHGNSAWTQEGFTREDRIAFFSAQSYLLPLPNSLGETLEMPLLSKPRFMKEAIITALETQTKSSRCCQQLTSAWQEVFDRGYYVNAASDRLLKPTLALADLPRLRHEFASAIRLLPSCGNRCAANTLNRLDQDLVQLFTKLAGYYRDVD